MAANAQFSTPPPPINLPNMSVPPPPTPNLSAPPPTLTTINTSANYQHRYNNHRDANRGFFKPFRPYHAPKVISGGQDALQDEFDGKRLRKSVMRKTVDYNSAIIKCLEVIFVIMINNCKLIFNILSSFRIESSLAKRLSGQASTSARCNILSRFTSSSQLCRQSN